MFSSKHIAFFHHVLFIGQVILAPLLIVLTLAGFLPPLWLASLGVFGLVVMVGVWTWSTDCPPTRWENELRKKEGRPTYSDTCLIFYLHQYTGITLPRRYSSIVPLSFMIAPIVVGVILLMLK